MIAGVESSREADLEAYRRFRRFIAEATDFERDVRPNIAREPFDLDRMRRLCERLGRPERRFAVAHVTGTKGKGSTCTFLAEILGAAGKRVGLYTSPHLVDLGERIAVCGRAAAPAELGAYYARIEPTLQEMRGRGERFTFFEIVTVVAFECFAAEQVEVAVVEVGLGGRLDSTNVVAPAATAIVSVGLDHTERLGNTLAAIAREKAGIVKPGIPVVLGRLPPEAESVICAIARERGSTVYGLPTDLGAEVLDVSEAGTRCAIRTPRRVLEGLRLRLVGRHMAENAAVAATLADILDGAGAVPVPEAALRLGLERAFIPARFQVVPGAPRFVVDGAHNPDGIAALVRAFRDVYGEQKPVAVFGVLREKNLQAMAEQLAGLASCAVAAPCGSPREIGPEQLRAALERVGIPSCAEPSAERAIERARVLAGPGGIVLVCGSLYLAGLTLRALGALPPPPEEAVLSAEYR